MAANDSFAPAEPTPTRIANGSKWGAIFPRSPITFMRH
jgi:hypothetical protein